MEVGLSDWNENEMLDERPFNQGAEGMIYFTEGNTTRHKTKFPGQILIAALQLIILLIDLTL